MSYGVRSMLAFWAGGAAIPSTPSTPPTPAFLGNAGLYMKPRTPILRKPRRFAKWKPRRRSG